jgi:hypothetical protein
LPSSGYGSANIKPQGDFPGNPRRAHVKSGKMPARGDIGAATLPASEKPNQAPAKYKLATF